VKSNIEIMNNITKLGIGFSHLALIHVGGGALLQNMNTERHMAIIKDIHWQTQLHMNWREKEEGKMWEGKHIPYEAPFNARRCKALIEESSESLENKTFSCTADVPYFQSFVLEGDIDEEIQWPEASIPKQALPNTFYEEHLLEYTVKIQYECQAIRFALWELDMLFPQVASLHTQTIEIDTLKKENLGDSLLIQTQNCEYEYLKWPFPIRKK
jgi:hypothetical protein